MARNITVTRGPVLTTLLILLLVAQLLGIVLGFVNWQSIVAHNQPHPELPLIGAILGIVGVAALVGVWLWRRVAVYVLGAVIAIGLISDAVLGIPSWALLIRIVLVGALFACIKGQWRFFH